MRVAVYLYVCDECTRATAMHASPRAPRGWQETADEQHICLACCLEIDRENQYPRLAEANVDRFGDPAVDAGFEDEPDP